MKCLYGYDYRPDNKTIMPRVPFAATLTSSNNTNYWYPSMAFCKTSGNFVVSAFCGRRQSKYGFAVMDFVG